VTQFSSAHVLLDLLSGKVVLVVEAQVPIALLERTVALEFGAAEVIRCASASDGLAAIRNGATPDLAIVDVADEAAASALIARLEEAGVALVITSSADSRHETSNPAVICIAKPYLEMELVMAIATAVGARAKGA
jgi:hypothetical protein